MTANFDDKHTGQGARRPCRFLRIRDVAARIGVSIATTRRWVKSGTFPAQRRIGPNSVAWVESEIDDWCAARAADEPWGGEQ